jgi:hypothetical protein
MTPPNATRIINTPIRWRFLYIRIGIMAFSLGLQARVHHREAAYEFSAFALPRRPMITENTTNDYWSRRPLEHCAIRVPDPGHELFLLHCMTNRRKVGVHEKGGDPVTINPGTREVIVT